MRRECVAYHGHAVVAYRHGIKKFHVSIVPDHYGDGHLDGGVLGGLGSERAIVERAIQICLAGPAAQKRFHFRSFRRRHGRQDYDCASGLARFLAGSGEREFLRYQENLTHNLIDRCWEDIERVAAALLDGYQLTATEVEEIVDPDRGDRADRLRWIEAMAADDSTEQLVLPLWRR
jgi:hypothetical protein